MRLKPLFTLLLLISSFSLLAQVDSKADYSRSELKQFTRIHQYVLDHPFDIIGSMERNAKQIGISPKRLTEIFQAQAKGEKVELTKKEAQGLEKLKLLMGKDKAQYDAQIAKFMKSQSMNPSRYFEIEKQYHESPKLQEEVREISNQ